MNDSWPSPISNSTPNESRKIKRKQIKTNIFEAKYAYLDGEIKVDDRLLLSSWGLPEVILKKYREIGLTQLFSWQADCLCTGNVLEHGNLIYSAPTSAGKTLVSELLLLKSILERRKKALFILPFVSVAREKTLHLQHLYEEAGIKVGGFFGNSNQGAGLSHIDVAVCTIEKANNIINRLLEEPDSIQNLGVVVVDELHMVGDKSRGYLLELLITKLRYVMAKAQNMHKIQLIGMSATLPNLTTLAHWMNADLYQTQFRPINLTEMTKISFDLYDADFNVIRKLDPKLKIANDDDMIIPLCVEVLNVGSSVLIFCPTKNWCEKLAETIALQLNKLRAQKVLTFQSNDVALMEVREQLKRTPSGLDAHLSKTIPFAVAYHHAGLTFEEREIVEAAFRRNCIKVLVATSTLASGVNLPARRVIIRSVMFNGKPIDPLAYKQMVGRAGRKGLDTEGESILICKPSEKAAARNLLQSQLPQVTSCLDIFSELHGVNSSLKRAILEIIVSGIATTAEDVKLYIECTLLSAAMHPQKEASDFCKEKQTEMDNNLEQPNAIQSCLKFLQDFEFIQIRKEFQDEVERDVYKATQLGMAVMASGLSTDEGLKVFRELEKARKCMVLENDLHIVYLVTPIYLQDSCVIDWYHYLCLWEALKPDEKRVAELVGIQDRLISSLAMQSRVNKSASQVSRSVSIHKRFYMALILHDLINESPLNDVVRKYKINRGVVQTLQQSSSSFAGMVTIFCNRLCWTHMELLLSNFQSRLSTGVSQQLVDLVRISFLDAQRARIFYNAGLPNVAAIANSNQKLVEGLLRKSSAFHSKKKQDGENEWELEERLRSAKCIYGVGEMKAMTEFEAASAIISEAKIILQSDLVDLGIDAQLINVNGKIKKTLKISPKKSSSKKKSVLKRSNNYKCILTPPSTLLNSKFKNVKNESLDESKYIIHKIDNIPCHSSHLSNSTTDNKNCIDSPIVENLFLNHDNILSINNNNFECLNEKVDSKINDIKMHDEVVSNIKKSENREINGGNILENNLKNLIITNQINHAANDNNNILPIEKNLIDKNKENCITISNLNNKNSVINSPNNSDNELFNSSLILSNGQISNNINIKINDNDIELEDSKYSILHNSFKSVHYEDNKNLEAGKLEKFNKTGVSSISCENLIAHEISKQFCIIDFSKENVIKIERSCISPDLYNSSLDEEIINSNLQRSEFCDMNYKKKNSILSDDLDFSGNLLGYCQIQSSDVDLMVENNFELNHTAANKSELCSEILLEASNSNNDIVLEENVLMSSTNEMDDIFSTLSTQIKVKKSLKRQSEFQISHESCTSPDNMQDNFFTSIMHNSSRKKKGRHFSDDLYYDNKIVNTPSKTISKTQLDSDVESVMKLFCDVSNTSIKSKQSPRCRRKRTNQNKSDETFKMSKFDKDLNNLPHICKQNTTLNNSNYIFNTSENLFLDIDPNINIDNNQNIYLKMAEDIETNTITSSQNILNVPNYDLLELKENYLVENSQSYNGKFIENIGNHNNNQNNILNLFNFNSNEVNQCQMQLNIEKNDNFFTDTIKYKTVISKALSNCNDQILEDNFLPLNLSNPKLEKKIDMICGTQNTANLSNFNDQISIIDVASNQQLFTSFIRELEIQQKFSICLACEPIPKALTEANIKKIGAKFNKVKPSNERKIIVDFPIECTDLMLVGIAFSWEENDVYYLALTQENINANLDATMAPAEIDNDLSVDERLEGLKSILSSNQIKDKMILGFDMKSQYKILSQCCGISLDSNLFDVKLANWILDPSTKETNLISLCLQYAPDIMQHFKNLDSVAGVGSLGSSVSHLTSARMRACLECIGVRYIEKNIVPLLNKNKLFESFRRVEMPTLVVLARMELNGLGFDVDESEEQCKVMEKQLLYIEERAYELAGHAFSLSSIDEISRVLFVELNLPHPSPQFNKKSNGKVSYSTSKNILEKIKNLHPLPSLILQWRQITIALTKVVFPLRRECVLNSKLSMKRIYSLSDMHTATGRVTMYEPNLQSIPKDFEIVSNYEIANEGYACKSFISMRNVFIPFKNGLILAADYAQLELRLIAHLSGDKKLINILNSNVDVFKTIAAQIKNCEENELSNDDRQHAKQVCYGMIYGIGAKALAEQMDVDENEASMFIEAFKNKYIGMRSFLHECVRECRVNKYVTTMLGRRRYLPNISSTNIHSRAHAERQAVNTTVQGSAADLVKLAMIKIDQQLIKSFPNTIYTHRHKTKHEIAGGYFLLQLHDELIYEVCERDLAQVMNIVKSCMQGAINISVKLPVKLKIGPSWGRLMEVTE